MGLYLKDVRPEQCLRGYVKGEGVGPKQKFLSMASTAPFLLFCQLLSQSNKVRGPPNNNLSLLSGRTLLRLGHPVEEKHAEREELGLMQNFPPDDGRNTEQYSVP